MISFYLRFFRAKDKKTLIKLADDYIEYNKKHPKNLFLKKTNRDFIVAVEHNTILQNIFFNTANSNISGNFALTVFSVANPLKKGPFDVRICTSLFLTLLPIKEEVYKLLTLFNVKNENKPLCFLLLSAFYETMMIRFGCKKTKLNLFEIPIQVLFVTAILVLSKNLIYSIERFIPNMILQKILYFLIVVSYSKVSQDFIEYGLTPISNFITKQATFLTSMFNKPVQYPQQIANWEILTPPSLTCPLCQKLLNDPLKSGGRFYCKKCIEFYVYKMKKFYDPFTNEEIDPLILEKSFLLNNIIYKYTRFIDDERQQNEVTEEEEDFLDQN